MLPTLRDALAQGGSIKGLALAEAFWARMCEGTREDGSVIEANDPNWDALTTAAKEAKMRPATWLEQTTIYDDLADDPKFATAFAEWLDLIWKEGSAAAIDAYCA